MTVRSVTLVCNLWPARCGSRWNFRQIALKRDVVGHLARLCFFGAGTNGPAQDSRARRLELRHPRLIQTFRGMADEAGADPVIVRDVAQPVPHTAPEQWPVDAAI